MSTYNPKDSMTSTWRNWDRSQWTISHRLLDTANVHHIDLNRNIPVHSKQDTVPYLSDWQSHRWIIVHASIPMLIHQLFISFNNGNNFGSIFAFFYYYFASRWFTTRELRRIRELGHIYGFLDGDKHERDGVPDSGVSKTLISIFLAGSLRPLMMICLAYNATQGPASINWGWLAVELSLYGIVLDFWFYWYHRIMHDVNGLWKYHRTHHLTKHPNPLLTIYADEEQEFFDIIGIPLMTYLTMKLLGMPMGFYEWHVCQLYVQFSEVVGHSGLRIHASTPSPFSWLMRWFNADLVIEDHDLHHRKGWRKSYNYGKQTRIWDRLFGTCGDRIESSEANIDYQNQAVMPIF